MAHVWSKCPNFPLDEIFIVGGHQEPFSSGHLTIPKRSPAELPGAHVIWGSFICVLAGPNHGNDDDYTNL